MADEELHETTADDQKDLQSADDTAAVEETTEDVVDKTSVDEDQSDDDDLDIPMDRVEAVLNATVDKDSLSPQMQRMMNRQAAVLRADDHRSGVGRGLLPDHRLSDSAHRRLEPGHRVRNHHGRFHYDHVVALSRFSPFRLFHRGLFKRRRVLCDPASFFIRFIHFIHFTYRVCIAPLQL